NYNDCQLKIKTRKLIDNLKCSDETRRFLFDALDWIDKWGFSRSFGLGTRIPFDEKYLVDSLSDSTIYMAFYTVKRFLFSDFEGKRWIVNPKIVNDNLWDYVFGFTDDFNFENIPHPSDNLEILNSPIGNIQINAENLDLKDPEHLEIAASLDLKTILMKMKKSFEYFYPVDLRVSGKDLLKNHLIFFLMNHVAIFPEKFWPKRIFTNGHLLLNNEKMSKSTGNYLSAKDCLEKYGSLATRMALAHSGDFNEDANFQESIANSCILKIYNFFEFINKIKDLNKNIDITRTKRKIQGIVDYFYQQGVRELELQIEKLNLEDMETQDAINNIKIQDFVHELINLKFADKYFLEGIYYCYIHCISSYESMRYADVLKYGFYEMLHTKETYLSLNGSNESELMIVYVYFILMMMYPILPVCREVFEGFFDLDNENIPQPPIEVINDQFFRWPINIYDKGSSDNCLNYLMSTLDSLDNYKR
ncbi:putative leucine--tRNA ligase, cytoplasmic, partial [Dictyocoela roeselum]